MARRTQKPKQAIFQLQVVLKEVEPQVWRRFLVHSDVTLGALHRTLNEVMGWEDSHLHQFTIQGRSYGNPDLDEAGDQHDEDAFALDKLVKVGDRFIYEYDFGDDWIHQVVVEKKLPVDPRLTYPVCIGGARACPPESCGGPPGYEELQTALVNDDNDELVEWVGGFFDPHGFDVNRTNRALRAQ